jgi:S-DNA-T family DNA segregation ATPase FtsK/SpoIIIE
MLLLTSNSSIPTRLQGPWVSEKEIHQIVGFWKKQSSPVFLEELRDASTDDPANENNLITDGDDDDLVPQAMELVIKSGLGSTSMLTRKLKIGYPRAGRIMDILEERGVVGPADGSKPRQVYKTAEDLNDLKSS